MPAITARPYQDQDVLRLVELFHACETIDRLGRVPSVVELQTELDAPSVDKRHDIRLWQDDHGSLIGFARLGIRSVATTVDVRWWLRIHPDYRGGILVEQMLDWARDGAARLGAARGLPATLLTGVRSDQRDIITALEAYGFEPACYFVTMTRPLMAPLPTPPALDSFAIRPLHAASEAAGWVALVNDAFCDHWQHHELTVEAFEHELTTPRYRPEFYQLAVTADGAFAAFCQCAFEPAATEAHGEQVGWIALLGTRPAFRRRGLGQTLLVQWLYVLQAAGATVASLQVDTNNPTGALRLYETSGFDPQETWIVYRKALAT
jgi:ribosomal protein S18 acetylase RimI-like enzyme